MDQSHRIGRRSFVVAGVGTALTASCSGEDLSLDQAYERFHGTDVDNDGGLTNHGPMASEALDAMGQAGSIGDFVDEYEDRVRPRPKGASLAEDEQVSALGVTGERGRWMTTYEELVDAGDPFVLFAQRWATLAPGFAAAGLHGVLRTAHALRALAATNNDIRRRELAHGLALWSARHQTLPGQPGAFAEEGLDVVSALARVPRVSAPSEGLIVPRLRAVEDAPEFAAAVEAVDLEAMPVERALTELASVCSRLFLAAPEPGIVELHGITGTSAVRLMLPWLSDAQKIEAVGYVFQVVAAIHAIQKGDGTIPAAPSSADLDVEEIADCAGDQSDEHAIKLAEVAIREYELDSRPEFLAAAARVLD